MIRVTYVKMIKLSLNPGSLFVYPCRIERGFLLE